MESSKECVRVEVVVWVYHNNGPAEKPLGKVIAGRGRGTRQLLVGQAEEFYRL